MRWARAHILPDVCYSSAHSADLMISLQALYKFAKASACRWTRSSNKAGAGFFVGFSRVTDLLRTVTLRKRYGQ